MKAFVQWLDYDTESVIDSDHSWHVKCVDASLVQMLAQAQWNEQGDFYWINDTKRKKRLNVFSLELRFWVHASYPKLQKKAPAWIHDPLSWQIRWANEVKNGRINEPERRTELHA